MDGDNESSNQMSCKNEKTVLTLFDTVLLKRLKPAMTVTPETCYVCVSKPGVSHFSVSFVV